MSPSPRMLLQALAPASVTAHTHTQVHVTANQAPAERATDAPYDAAVIAAAILSPVIPSLSASTSPGADAPK